MSVAQKSTGEASARKVKPVVVVQKSGASKTGGLDSGFMIEKTNGAVAYRALYTSDRTGRIEIIRHGINAAAFRELASNMGLQQKELLNALRISQATVSRKISDRKPLSASDSEKVLGVATLIGQVESMLAESSAGEGFDAAEWVGRWLSQPHRALGGKAPLSYLDTNEGVSLVADLLARQQSGAYS
ncbi:antitoxin Xre-like helix-turn-helix domain-containing protein [Asticcacaulis sp. W401b]|uniref:type II RES/Xre toxin-antitoxin system antitoxin n=1 Tax=Asticcacaulis sp. W401b TaxID=3388666 RepID=UPI003970EFF4